MTLPLGHGPRPRPARLLPHLHPGHPPPTPVFFDDVRMVALFFLRFCRRRFFFVFFCVCLVGSSLALLLFFLRDTDQANRSHSPCTFCWSCSFFSPMPLSFFPFACPPVSAVRPSASAFFQGAFLSPVRFWDFLDCSEALLWTLVGRAFRPVFFPPCFCVPPVWCLRFFSHF